MARLIDVDALREEHCKRCSDDIIEGCKTDPVCAFLLWVNDAPTVDAVEVVRCCECNKSGVLEHNGKMFCKEPMGCLGCVPTKPDNFCSYGERRENEQA